jgi:curved DNA-binding protein CbpA
LQAFGLSKDATADDVKRAYHEAALKEHPDTGGTHEGFLKLQEHYKSALRMVQR